MVLLTGFYSEINPDRRGEFLECLRRNEANRWLEEIHLCLEFPARPEEFILAHSMLATPKLRLIVHGRRVSFHDLFSYANAHLSGRRVAIANADIFFD